MVIWIINICKYLILTPRMILWDISYCLWFIVKSFMLNFNLLTIDHFWDQPQFDLQSFILTSLMEYHTYICVIKFFHWCLDVCMSIQNITLICINRFLYIYIYIFFWQFIFKSVMITFQFAQPFTVSVTASSIGHVGIVHTVNICIFRMIYHIITHFIQTVDWCLIVSDVLLSIGYCKI